MNIGFIGLGVMGNPMAQNLQRHPDYELCVFDVDIVRADPLVALGARRAESVAEAVTGMDVIFTSLPGPKQVAEVAFADNGLFENIKRHAVWIDLSTNNLETAKQIHSMAADRQVEILDAPVSGGDEGARAGTLTVLVGGDASVYEKHLPVLNVIGGVAGTMGPKEADPLTNDIQNR